MADVFMLPTEPIRLNTRNEWLHGEDLIQPRVASLFARSVQVQADGSYAVCVGRESQPIAVDDTAFWVTSMVMEAAPSSRGEAFEGSALSRVRLELSDGQSEWLDPATLMQSADNALYCRIQRQGFDVPCRFSPQQYHALALHAQHTPRGYVVNVGRKTYTIGSYDRRPKACPDN